MVIAMFERSIIISQTGIGSLMIRAKTMIEQNITVKDPHKHTIQASINWCYIVDSELMNIVLQRLGFSIIEHNIAADKQELT